MVLCFVELVWYDRERPIAYIIECSTTENQGHKTLNRNIITNT